MKAGWGTTVTVEFNEPQITSPDCSDSPTFDYTFSDTMTGLTTVYRVEKVGAQKHSLEIDLDATVSGTQTHTVTIETSHSGNSPFDLVTFDMQIADSICDFQVITPPTVVDHDYVIGAPMVTYNIDEFTYDLATECPLTQRITVDPTHTFFTVVDKDTIEWYTIDNSKGALVYEVLVEATLDGPAGPEVASSVSFFVSMIQSCQYQTVTDSNRQ